MNVESTLCWALVAGLACGCRATGDDDGRRERDATVETPLETSLETSAVANERADVASLESSTDTAPEKPPEKPLEKQRGEPLDVGHVDSARSIDVADADVMRVTVPGSTAVIELRRLPRVETDAPGALWIGTHEIPWEAYDAFVFALDRAEHAQDPPDAYSRPSKPYITMDRGFGHAGYPAISVSYRGAREFCRWLSHATGERFRLPTEAEWERACRASEGADEVVPLDERAWFRENAGRKTHPIGSKRANALGLHDLLGNAAEWCRDDADTGVARGGSFREPAASLSWRSRRTNDRALNASDPQIPKSVWWLADGGFIGLRVVCER